jgi:integrase
VEKKHRDKILKGEQSAQRQPKRGFTEASEEFMAHVRIQHEGKPNTISRVSTSLASLRAFFRQRHVSTIRPSDVNRYALWRRGEHEVRPITLRHDLDNLSKFFEWARTMDLCPDNPVKSVSKPSADDAVRMHFVTPAEELDYFQRCNERGYRNLADVARLMLDQGCRPEEVMSLERAACSPTHIKILRGKTKAAKRTLKLTAQARIIVERRLSESEGSRWLFPTPKRSRGDRHITKLNGPHDRVCTMRAPELTFVLYDFRHTFATRAAENGMPLATLAALLGHSSLRVLHKYIHPQQDDMDRAMDRASSGPTQAHTESISGTIPAIERKGDKWTN